MLFCQKSEKAKFINDGQLAFEEIFNETEAESDESAAEPIIENVARKSHKTEQHCDREKIRVDLETKKIVYELLENQRIGDECGSVLTEYTKEYLTTILTVILEKVYKCKNCDKNDIKANIVKTENRTPAGIIAKELPDASVLLQISCRESISLASHCTVKSSTGN